MRLAELLRFIRRHKLCVVSSLAVSGQPQSSAVEVAVSDQMEFVFAALVSTRKVQNLRRDGRAALVVGWSLGGGGGDPAVQEQTVQVDGNAEELQGKDLERLRAIYLAAHPECLERLAWPGLTFMRVRPHWLRYSDFREGGGIFEFDDVGLSVLLGAK
jgi:nitroimidazol reductase NimA-like FMN-containing flavoprotein (pyridoxamine 5'-phosphate oxidase superfamily)